MIHDPCSIDHVLEVLNSIVKADPKAAFTLIETRVPCNAVLAEHPTVQVVGGDTPTVGLLGIINGILGVYEDGWGPILICFEVVCPKCKAETGSGNKVGDPCAHCGETLVLGDIIEFKRTREKE